MSDVELRAEPIIAWRAWKVDSDRLRLRSLTNGPFNEAIWPIDGPIKAECWYSHEAPAPEADGFYESLVFDQSGSPENIQKAWEELTKGNTHSRPACGIYATKDRKTAQTLARCYPGAIYGEVLLWGTVWEHTSGYRAQYAKPLSICSMNPTPEQKDLIHKLTSEYNIEIVQAKKRDSPVFWPTIAFLVASVIGHSLVLAMVISAIVAASIIGIILTSAFAGGWGLVWYHLWSDLWSRL